MPHLLFVRRGDRNVCQVLLKMRVPFERNPDPMWGPSISGKNDITLQQLVRKLFETCKPESAEWLFPENLPARPNNGKFHVVFIGTSNWTPDSFLDYDMEYIRGNPKKGPIFQWADFPFPQVYPWHNGIKLADWYYEELKSMRVEDLVKLGTDFMISEWTERLFKSICCPRGAPCDSLHCPCIGDWGRPCRVPR